VKNKRTRDFPVCSYLQMVYIKIQIFRQLEISHFLFTRPHYIRVSTCRSIALKSLFYTLVRLQTYTGVPKRCIHIIIRNINLVYTSFWDTLYVHADCSKRHALVLSYLLNDYGLL
jgi:hypothetical protein